MLLLAEIQPLRKPTGMKEAQKSTSPWWLYIYEIG